MAMKNLWSLNIDELLAANEIKERISDKNQEVFFPLNSQMKGVDLVLVNLATKKTKTIQIKGSRTFTPTSAQTKIFGEGNTTWFIIQKKDINDSANNADFYVFVLHCLTNTAFKKDIHIDYLIIPTMDLKKICAEKMARKRDTQFHFFIWIDTKELRAFDISGGAEQLIHFEPYLNNWSILEG